VRVPDFLVRQFYVAGSLRNTDDGFTLQARNPVGDGMLVGIRDIRVDGVPVDVGAITATRVGDAATYRAADVSRSAPVVFRKGDVVTFRISGPQLGAGDHALEVALIERDLGLVTLGITDRVA
jgi:hypothetical protein